MEAGLPNRRIDLPSPRGYLLMDLEPNGKIDLTGFRKQKSHNWNHPK